MTATAEAKAWDAAHSLLDQHLRSLGANARSRVFLIRYANKWKAKHGEDAQSADAMFEHLMGQEYLLSYLEQMANPGE